MRVKLLHFADKPVDLCGLFARRLWIFNLAQTATLRITLLGSWDLEITIDGTGWLGSGQSGSLREIVWRFGYTA